MLQEVCSRSKLSPEHVTSLAVQLSLDCIRVIESTKDKTAHEPPRTRSGRIREDDRPQLAGPEKDTHRSTRVETVRVAVAKTLSTLASYEAELESVQHTRVAFYLVKLFSTILDRICEPGNLSSGHLGLATATASANDGRKRALSPRSSIPTSKSEAGNILCHLFIELLALVSTSSQGHCAVWDGAMFLLLKRAGTLLVHYVFVDPQGSATGFNQANHHDAQEAGNSVGSAVSEASSIVWLLSRALPLYARRDEVQPEQHEASRSKIECRGQLSAIAMERMQKTLLKAVFPGDEESFGAGFLPPPDPGTEHDEGVSHIRSKDVSNWYKKELWSLVGWDMLRDTIEFREGSEGQRST